jgi:hypothetical protein
MQSKACFMLVDPLLQLFADAVIRSVSAAVVLVESIRLDAHRVRATLPLLRQDSFSTHKMHDTASKSEPHRASEKCNPNPSGFSTRQFYALIQLKKITTEKHAR